MIVFNSLDEIKDIDNTAVAVGNFDGVHRGHRALIENTVKTAGISGHKSAVFTFSELPKNVMAGETKVKSILYKEDKARIIEELGVDYLFNIPFTQEICQLGAYDFVSDLLIDKFKMKELCCGFNYRFGYMTGNYSASPDSAFAAFLYDTRPDKKCWSKEICDMVGVDFSHLPPLVQSTDIVGALTEKAALEMGLQAGTPVFSGGGDVSLTGVGAGAVEPGDTHIYTGTSGWVSSVIEKQELDINAMIGAIPGVDPTSFNYYAELETAGKCLEWARDHIGLDDLDIFAEHRYKYEDSESAQKNIYSYIMESAQKGLAEIERLVEEVEVGKVYTGTVKRIMTILTAGDAAHRCSTMQSRDGISK